MTNLPQACAASTLFAGLSIGGELLRACDRRLGLKVCGAGKGNPGRSIGSPEGVPIYSPGVSLRRGDYCLRGEFSWSAPSPVAFR